MQLLALIVLCGGIVGGISRGSFVPPLCAIGVAFALFWLPGMVEEMNGQSQPRSAVTQSASTDHPAATSEVEKDGDDSVGMSIAFLLVIIGFAVLIVKMGGVGSESQAEITPQVEALPSVAVLPVLRDEHREEKNKGMGSEDVMVATDTPRNQRKVVLS
jgi:hypothetical protein